MGLINKIFGKHTEINNSHSKKYNGYYSQQTIVPPNLSTGDYLKSYGEIGWLYACVSKIAQNVADVDWSAYNGDKELTENQSQALAVLNHPNPFMSRYELMEITDMYISLCGKCFWVLEKDKAGRNREIWCISPLDMWVVPDRDNYIKGYIYKTGLDQIPFDPNQVIFFNMPNPYNPYDGIGPAQGARNSLEADKYSAEHNRNFFYNGAKLSGILNVEADLDDDTWDKLKEEFEDRHVGVDNAHRIATIEGSKANFMDLTMNNKDMDFYNLRQMTRDEILGAFGVHKSILGLTDDVSRANAETAEYVFQKHVIRPRLRRIQDKLNNEFVQLFGEETVLQFTDPVPENKDFLVSTVSQLVNKSITVNESREILNKMLDDVNLDPLPDGDTIYFPDNLVTMGTPPPNPNATPPSENTGDDDLLNSSGQDDGQKMIKKKLISKIRLKQLIEKKNLTRIQDRDKMSKPLEDEFQSTVKSYLDTMKADVIKKVENGSKDPVDLDIWNKTLQGVVQPLYEKIFKTGGQAVVNEFKGYKDIIKKDVGDTGIEGFNVYFDVKDPKVIKSIKNKISKITKVNQTTKDSVATLIKQAYESEDDFTIAKISDMIKNMPDFDEARAKCIAQTETISSLNQSTMLTYQQNSHLIDGKAWLAIDDGHARETHLQASMDYSEDSPISVDQDFNVGGYNCQCPGDSGLPAEEVINCRCATMPIVNTNSDDSGNEDKNSFTEAESIKEANDYAKNVLEIENVSYKGCDIVTANDWNRGLTDAFNNFPELKNNFGFAGESHERNKMVKDKLIEDYTEKLAELYPNADKNILKDAAKDKASKFVRRYLSISKNSLADSWCPKTEGIKNFKGITVNKVWGKDSKAFTDMLKLNVKSKFHPIGCDTIKSTLDHEIGHQLDNMLGIGKIEDIQALLDDRTKEELTNDLSTYAWKNNNPDRYSEMIAEAWAEYCNNPEPREIAKKVGQTIENEYTKKFGGAK